MQKLHVFTLKTKNANIQWTKKSSRELPANYNPARFMYNIKHKNKNFKLFPSRQILHLKNFIAR